MCDQGDAVGSICMDIKLSANEETLRHEETSYDVRKA